MEAVRRKRRPSFLSVVNPRDPCLSRAWCAFSTGSPGSDPGCSTDHCIHQDNQLVFSTLPDRLQRIASTEGTGRAPGEKCGRSRFRGVWLPFLTGSLEP